MQAEIIVFILCTGVCIEYCFWSLSPENWKPWENPTVCQQKMTWKFHGRRWRGFVLKIPEWKYTPCTWAAMTFQGMLSHLIEILFAGCENDTALHPPLPSPYFTLQKTIYCFVYPQSKDVREHCALYKLPTEEQIARAGNAYPWNPTLLPNVRCFSSASSNTSAVALKEILMLVTCVSDSWWQQKRPSLFNASLHKQ